MSIEVCRHGNQWFRPVCHGYCQHCVEAPPAKNSSELLITGEHTNKTNAVKIVITNTGDIIKETPKDTINIILNDNGSDQTTTKEKFEKPSTDGVEFTNSDTNVKDTIKWNITLGNLKIVQGDELIITDDDVKTTTQDASKWQPNSETKSPHDDEATEDDTQKPFQEDVTKKENAENTTGKTPAETPCSHDSSCAPSVFMIMITKLSKLFDIAKNCFGT